MAERPILKIEIDDSAWLEFSHQYDEYQKSLASQKDAWASTNAGVKQMGDSFEHAEETFDGLTAKAGQDKLGKSFVALDKSSKETAKSWTNIQKTIEKSAKDLSGMVRDGGKFSALGSFLGLGGLAVGAGALFGAVRGADNSLADQNILNRKLGLKPGEEAAFSNTYEKAGGDRAMLSKVAAAQADPNQWPTLQAAGFTQQDIRTRDAAELSADLLKRVGGRVNTFGLPQTALWAHSLGVDQFVDTNAQRQAGSYSSNDYAAMARQFSELVPKLAASQKQLDEATAARSKLEASLAQDELELSKAFIKLNPLMIDAAGKVTNFITAFAESGQLEKNIKLAENAFDAVGTAAQWLADKLNDLFGLKGKDGQGTPLYSAPAGSVGANLAQFGTNVWDSMHGGKWDSGPSKAVNWNPFGNNNAASGDVGSASAMDRLLDATRHVESSDGKNLVGPVTREGWQAKGPYQMSPSNIARYHVKDPFDEADERRAAREMYTDLSKKYGGNLHQAEAAYNWGEGNVDKFLKDHKGQWDEQSLPRDVQDYLRKMDEAGANSQPANPFTNPKTVGDAVAVDGQNVQKTKPFKSDADTAADIRKVNATNPDNQAVDSVTARLMRGLGMIGNGLREGGGSQFRTPDSPTRAPSTTQQAPFDIRVTVTSPPGSSTVVTAGSIAQ